MSSSRVALIGLDTSHTIQFAMRMQSPDCDAAQRVEGMRAVSCLRFETPFTNAETLDQRQSELEAWGINVTTSFDEAVADCDAIMLEINYGALHLEYFERVAALGKPVFIDKPLAGGLADGKRICELAAAHGTRVMSCSSLRFARELLAAIATVPEPTLMSIYSPLGSAPAGDSLIWYGVHGYEMIQRVLGGGATAARAYENETGIVAVVDFADNRQAVIESRVGCWAYGGRLQQGGTVGQFLIDASWIYHDQLEKIAAFFHGAEPAATVGDACEVLQLMCLVRHAVSHGSATPDDL